MPYSDNRKVTSSHYRTERNRESGIGIYRLYSSRFVSRQLTDL